ncbi:hypothetical protein ACF0H5_013542 [Mactra antiquata]
MDMNKVYVREIERNDEKKLKIYQSEIGDVGCVVWDAAIVLSKYLETDDFDGGRLWIDKNVVELGAGTGVVGLMAASYGANVTITDLEEFVPLMQLNIDTNMELFNNKVDARSLKWGTDLESTYSNIDVVLVADCIYYGESLEPLVKTLDDLSGINTCVYCCYEERTSDIKQDLQNKFLRMVKQIFNIEKIPLNRQDQEYCSDDIHILKMTKLKVT